MNGYDRSEKKMMMACSGRGKLLNNITNKGKRFASFSRDKINDVVKDTIAMKNITKNGVNNMAKSTIKMIEGVPTVVKQTNKKVKNSGKHMAEYLKRPIKK